jgi:hypothetical protein
MLIPQEDFHHRGTEDTEKTKKKGKEGKNNRSRQIAPSVAVFCPSFYLLFLSFVFSVSSVPLW